jgi:hypothetical protein
MRSLLRVLIAVLVTLCIGAAAIAATAHSETVVATMVDSHSPGPRADTRCPECGMHRLRACVQYCLATIDMDTGWITEIQPSASQTGVLSAGLLPAGMSSKPALTPPIA